MRILGDHTKPDLFEFHVVEKSVEFHDGREYLRKDPQTGQMIKIHPGEDYAVAQLGVVHLGIHPAGEAERIGYVAIIRLKKTMRDGVAVKMP